MTIKSDIEIAQEHTPERIGDIAAVAGIDETYLELYGNREKGGAFMLSPGEFVPFYAQTGANKCALPFGRAVGAFVPVTIGNIIGGCGFGALIWATQRPAE